MKRLSHTLFYIIGVFLFLAIGSPSAFSKEFVIVIDPGHGGHDIGAPGTFINEKDINLSVALKLGALIERNIPDAKVVYTRKTDKFITLDRRCKIANEAHGDIFLSIHTDSAEKNRESATGSSVFVLGLTKSPENLAVAKRENTVMVMENGVLKSKSYDANSAESQIMFELNQKKHLNKSLSFAKILDRELVKTAGRISRGIRQANFQVLVFTSMPSVLIELDFICNPDQEKFLASAEGQDSLAQSICNSLKQYIKNKK